MKYTEKMSKKINTLLVKNHDAEKGYKKAAKLVDDIRLKQFFESQAHNRSEFGMKLSSEIKKYGEIPEKGTSFESDIHRTWMDIKTTFTSNDEEAILNEVQRGEKLAVEAYNEIINDTALPPTTQSLLTKQREQIKSTVQSAMNFEQVVS
ncbi:MAG: PA2169 family four-helix-bundle protein [Altibacter sp.]|uniref:ferritin-like domain-containing protein n=1 Tax=Altibacter sp. TaxID=2024823 RepID=UPI001DB433F3|nr:PA2169 family four-helix-bundle protein [Altibacter sp.]MBZ0326713.1 PA2169 family four-helix-bundle protein [Altibacter sp.]